MKYIKYFSGILAAAVISSCVEESDPCQNAANDELVAMTFSAIANTSYNDETPVRTTYSGGNVYWEAEDAISVFAAADGSTTSHTEFKIENISDDKTSATFAGLTAPDADCYYAVYPYSSANEYNAGALTVNLPSEQKGISQGFASASNLAVACLNTESEESYLSFYNVPALLGFRFETEEDAANTKSVTFRFKKSDTEGDYWGIAGKAVVTVDDSNIPSAGEGDVTYVTLTAPDGGFVCNDQKTNYYIPVYPVGDFTSVEITFVTNDGDTFVKKNNADGKLQRSTMKFFGHVPNPYDTLPDEITINLDFYNENNLWPFKEAQVKRTNQQKTGDNYTYVYNYEDKSVDFPFILCGGERTDADTDNVDPYYTYDEKYDSDGDGTNDAKCLFITGQKSCYIKLPGIRGRYLKSVSMSHATEANRRFRIQENSAVSASEAGLTYSSSQTKSADGTALAYSEIIFPTSKTTMGQAITPIKEQSYYMMFTSGRNLKLTNITLVYTKTKPE